MNSLYHRGIISPLPITQLESYMEVYGFRITEQYDDIITMIRDPAVTLSGMSHMLTWNLDHYPATQQGTRQLEHDLAQWNVSEHDRMVLLLTHQERYGDVVAHIWMGTQTYASQTYPSPVEIG